MSEKCWVCEGLEPRFLGKRCEKHDVCDVCKTKRSEIEGTPWGTKTGFICQKCETARIKKAISDFSKEEHADMEFEYNDYVKCPYCGYKYHPDDLYESTDNFDCPNCLSTMEVEVNHSITYSAYKRTC